MVSHRIQNLEKRLCGSLLDLGRHTRQTEPGELFYRPA
ncbi:hypothetical protein PSH90_08665 [Pseudomonas sp. FP1762]|nr:MULTISPECIES: hypothetical protein [Pseudomonas]WLG64167.1 hypothetical protein PSH90_08665 [Pseudomonas sp. FP1762]